MTGPVRCAGLVVREGNAACGSRTLTAARNGGLPKFFKQIIPLAVNIIAKSYHTRPTWYAVSSFSLNVTKPTLLYVTYPRHFL